MYLRPHQHIQNPAFSHLVRFLKQSGTYQRASNNKVRGKESRDIDSIAPYLEFTIY